MGILNFWALGKVISLNYYSAPVCVSILNLGFTFRVNIRPIVPENKAVSHQF